MNGNTQLIGVMGYPIAHSKSPAMHNAAFAELGLNWAYVPLLVSPDQVERALRGLSALGFKGANVTVPHKETVLPFMDELSPSAHAIQAVNTISITADGKLIGDNTDAAGFIQDLQENQIDIPNTSALVLGAGGSARATLYGLLQAGCPEITLLNRSVDKASQIAREISTPFHNRNIHVDIINETNISHFSKKKINCQLHFAWHETQR